MSDFLSRESEILGSQFSPTSAPSGGGAGDTIDFDRAASAFPDISLDGDIPSLPASNPSANVPAGGAGAGGGDFTFGDFADVEPVRETVRDVKVTGDDEIERFEDQFPDIGGHEAFSPPATQQQTPSFGIPAAPFAPRPQPSAFSSTPILQQPLPEEDEPEVIKTWREKQAAEIKARDEASAARRQETIAKAERSIDQFYEDYNLKKERNIVDNKKQEQTYLASLTTSLSEGTTWSRIAELVELQNSQSKTIARTGAGTTDLGRFREVVLRLRREGEGAPGAAGY
ncbi:hypothetical protein BD410DRAFT_728524 [Rickenella mellea]|uniref:Clathrin light chain n=1 Tax=Rickenella mellea TaxID=50990 RepID=A0A4Y7PSK0_9AGAM|nr:hypothetical protein BD410DRAFT_728524 [Rickenella mellea]